MSDNQVQMPSSPTRLVPQKSQSQKWLETVANALHGSTADRSANHAALEAAEIPRTTQEHQIILVCISDTHCTKPDLPPGDVILHAGDLSCRGTFEEVQDQLDWLNEQPHEFKVVIGGNHDYVLDDAALEKYRQRPKDLPLEGRRRADLRWGTVIYLDRSSTQLAVRGRTLSIYGSPMTPRFGKWPFQYPSEQDVWANTIPDGTDIVLTHGPPRGYLDPGLFNNAAGCPFLLQELRRVKPKLHVFGHVHDGRGQAVLTTSEPDLIYDGIVEGNMGWAALPSLLQAKVFGDASFSQITRLVNAAVVQGPPYAVVLPPIVVTV